MNRELKSHKPKEHRLNPNWEQLRQKLTKSNSPKKQFIKTPQQKSDTESQISILERSVTGVSSDGSQPNPLIPTSSDSSVTDVLAMDCEMVGVSSTGNKSALGRVTLVEDPRAAMLLYKKHRKQWEKSIKNFIRLKKKQTKRKHKRQKKVV